LLSMGLWYSNHRSFLFFVFPPLQGQQTQCWFSNTKFSTHDHVSRKLTTDPSL
jgi:hypothetical protein